VHERGGEGRFHHRPEDSMSPIVKVVEVIAQSERASTMPRSMQ